MRKLKCHMNMTIDGFVAGPEGELDWMSFDHDDKLLAFINRLTDANDTIIMGRKMAPGFLKYWEGVPQDSPEYSFAQKMVQTPKIIFSRSQSEIDGIKARMENGGLRTEIDKLKRGTGKDIVAYGGANFVSSLIKENLIDDLYLFVTPIAIGKGLSIFPERTKLKMIEATPYSTGVVVIHYRLVA